MTVKLSSFKVSCKTSDTEDFLLPKKPGCSWIVGISLRNCTLQHLSSPRCWKQNYWSESAAASPRGKMDGYLINFFSFIHFFLNNKGAAAFCKMKSAENKGDDEERHKAPPDLTSLHILSLTTTSSIRCISDSRPKAPILQSTWSRPTCIDPSVVLLPNNLTWPIC